MLVLVGVKVLVGVLVRVLVFVGVGVKEGKTNPVEVGASVDEGIRVFSCDGVAVHVGGRPRRVAVALGMMTSVGSLAGGNGLMDE